MTKFARSLIMETEKLVTLSTVTSNENVYIIKDVSGITIGRIFIIELSRENKYCSFRVKFYKNDKEGYKLLKEALRIILRTLIKNMNIYKVNTFIDDEVNTKTFTELGYELEGLITNSILIKNKFKNELIFGIDRDTFENTIVNKPILLKGNGIQLKLLTPENAEELLEYYIRNKEHLRSFEPARDESFYSLEVQKRDLIENYKGFLNGVSINLGIFKNNNLIGKIRVSNIVMGVFRNAFVGYSMDKNEQGRGYMKEALKLVLDYAFEYMELHRIEATTLLDNIKSQAVLLACGFKEIGISKKYLFINGEWRDHKIFYKINK
jgi:[ribosomal protein S5]-alanine N-acetyltransferase